MQETLDLEITTQNMMSESLADEYMGILEPNTGTQLCSQCNWRFVTHETYRPDFFLPLSLPHHHPNH